MRILFLGAAKRLSLLEGFQRAAAAEELRLSMYSAELQARVPVSVAAQILVAPRFDDPEFAPWLQHEVGRLGIDVVIPNMDTATVALSAAAGALQDAGSWAMVSSHELCVAMEDKLAAERWFAQREFPIPGRSSWPRILKRRRGFASRGQAAVADAQARERFLAAAGDPHGYLEQDLLTGTEYTVDAYVDRSGQALAVMPRIRLKVVDGEVEESLSSRHPAIERLTLRLLSHPGWRGPITLQFIDTATGPVLIEVNPRFGGGVTHAIHCGLDMPRWMLRERLGRALPPAPVAWQEGSLMTRCRRDIFP